jgi:hypothetical protein
VGRPEKAIGFCVLGLPGPQLAGWWAGGGRAVLGLDGGLAWAAWMAGMGQAAAMAGMAGLAGLGSRAGGRYAGAWRTN